MKKTIQLLFTATVLMLSSCDNISETKVAVDNSTIIKEVTESENEILSMMKEGKISESFARHRNNSDYRNIAEGNSRTYTQMDSVFKANALKNIKAYDFDVLKRDFLIIDNTNVLETIESNRKVIATTDSVIENRFMTLSILWRKDSTWNVSYVHGSYKKEM